MHLSDKRKEVINRIDDVFPTCVTVAIDDASFTSQYLKPYRAKHAGVIRSYEKKKKIIFCRECLDSNLDKRGWILGYKLFITATSNPLETKKEKWLNCQCQHCDFELNTPTPVPQPAPDVASFEQLRQVQNMLTKQGMQQHIDQGAYQQMQERIYRSHDELRHAYGRGQAQTRDFDREVMKSLANTAGAVGGYPTGMGKGLLAGGGKGLLDDPFANPTQHTMIQRAKKFMRG